LYTDVQTTAKIQKVLKHNGANYASQNNCKTMCSDAQQRLWRFTGLRNSKRNGCLAIALQLSEFRNNEKRKSFLRQNSSPTQQQRLLRKLIAKPVKKNKVKKLHPVDICEYQKSNEKSRECLGKRQQQSRANKTNMNYKAPLYHNIDANRK